MAVKMPPLRTHTGAFLRLLGYAMTTALATLGLAYLLSGQSVNERRQTFQEVQLHRVAHRCIAADMAEAMNRLLENHGLQLMTVPDTNGVDCMPLNEVEQPEATP